MNNVFNLKRASQYALYTARSGAKKYALTVGAGIVCALIFLFFMMGVGPHLNDMYTNDSPYMTRMYGYPYDPMWDNMTSIFWIGLYVALCVGASLSYNCLSSKEGRISELMIPASNLEKYVVRWLTFIPLTLLVYLVGFAAVDLIRMAVTYMFIDNAQYLMPLCKYSQGPLPFDFLTSPGFAILVLLQCLFFLGSTIWPKWSALKTLLALAIIALVFTLWSVWLSYMSFSNELTYGDPLHLEFEGATVVKFICYTLCIPCYIIAYFRIKEIEIIQRW